MAPKWSGGADLRAVLRVLLKSHHETFAPERVGTDWMAHAMARRSSARAPISGTVAIMPGERQNEYKILHSVVLGHIILYCSIRS